MDTELSYGGERLPLSLPSGAVVDQFAPRRVEREVTLGDFRAVISTPGADRTLAGPDLLVVVNDAYRTTPTPRILSWLDELDSGLLDRSRFLIATGTHAPPDSTQLRKIFGEFAPRVLPHLAVHDCRERDNMVSLGYDRFGGEVWLNRVIVEHQSVLTIGSVEPHYFAGYTGGRKAFFPGLTDLATIERNHNLANSLDCQPLRLEGNPMSDHLAQMTGMINISGVLSLQCVLDADLRLASVHCGPLWESFSDATKVAGEYFANRVDEPYDLVLAEMTPPLDANLYQIQKGLENCQAAVRDGGTVVLVSACREGIGSQHFYDLAARWDREANRSRDGRLHFGSHKLSRVINLGQRIHVRVFSELDAVEVARVFYEPLDNLQDFLLQSQEISPGLRVAVVHDAGNTVLVR